MPSSHRGGMAAAGASHPQVRQFLDIKRNRAPTAPGTVALEGAWAVRRALDAGVPVTALFVCPELVPARDTGSIVDDLRCAGALVLQVSGRVLRRMVDRDGPDGLAAIATLPPRRLVDIAVVDATHVVVADGIERPGNLGTLIRCADGAAAAGVVLAGHHVRLAHPLVVKASMGAVFSMPVVEAGRRDTLRWLRANRFRVVAADPSAPISYRNVDYRGRIAIVVGSERDGLADFWRRSADVRASIPMMGVTDSLNVGHAAALLLYEALHAAGP